jgi:hypothetical protein
MDRRRGRSGGMRPTITGLAVICALALAGCATATRSAAPPAAPVPAAFPAAVPGDTVLAYAVRQLPLFAGASRTPALAAPIQSLALTTRHAVWIACRADRRLTLTGSLSPSLAAQWVAALDAGHLARLRSDPPDPQHRGFWFERAGRVVYLDFVRHVSRAPCTGTECTAALHLDATLAALAPAMTTLSGYLSAHCAGA